MNSIWRTGTMNNLLLKSADALINHSCMTSVIHYSFIKMYEWHCKMELSEFLLILFVGILTFVGECPAGTTATPLCPVRAQPVYPAEVNGVVRCTCVHPYFGRNCRFKGKVCVSFSGFLVPMKWNILLKLSTKLTWITLNLLLLCSVLNCSP